MIAPERLLIEFAAGFDVSGNVTPAWVVVRPVNDAALGIIFELAFDRDDLTGLQRYGARDVDVGFNAQHQVALLIEFEEKTFVRTARAAARAEYPKHRSVPNHFDAARAASIERTYLRVIRLLGPSAATCRAGEERQSER